MVIMGSFSSKEEELRDFILNALNIQGLNAEKAFFGLMVYLDGQGFRLTIREDIPTKGTRT
jgi:hypothetical protein